MAAGNDGLWRSACNAIGLPAIADDPRFTSTTLRARHQAELKEILEAEFAKFTAAELIAKFNGAGVPCAPINTYSKALADPQVAHMQWVQEIKLPTGATARTFASPLRFSGKGFAIYRDPPALGQHNSEVFATTGKVAA
jgi:crotonobetainyl-CoA:carnitine CoA-transferase CaiB-like acyl-CoA transferase